MTTTLSLRHLLHTLFVSLITLYLAIWSAIAPWQDAVNAFGLNAPFADGTRVEIAPLASGGATAQFGINNGINTSATENNYLNHADLALIDADHRRCLAGGASPDDCVEASLQLAATLSAERDAALLAQCGDDPRCVIGVLQGDGYLAGNGAATEYDIIAHFADDLADVAMGIVAQDIDMVDKKIIQPFWDANPQLAEYYRQHCGTNQVVCVEELLPGADPQIAADVESLIASLNAPIALAIGLERCVNGGDERSCWEVQQELIANTRSVWAASAQAILNRAPDFGGNAEGAANATRGTGADNIADRYYDAAHVDLDDIFATNTVGGSTRIVPGGGLQAHEAAGGHLIQRHVGQTDADLTGRLNAQPNITVASSFPNRATAENAVSSALDANTAQINDFLNGSSNRLVLDHDTGSVVGSVVLRGSTTSVSSANLRVVLQRDASMPTGYRIVTGFPIP